MISKLGFETTLAARFVPELERATGTWQLRPEEVELELPPPLRLDVADWLVPVPLPRRLDWQLELGADRPLDVTCFIQSVTVDENRLRIDLGLVAR